MKANVAGIIFVGMLISLGCAVNAADSIVYTANSEWKTVDMSDVKVKPGSALDFSAYVEGPAGKYGKVITTPSGGLAFSGAPEREVRFFGFGLWGLTFRALIGKTDGATKANIKEYVALIKRQGYNMLRPTNFDMLVTWKSGKDGELDPVALDQIDYLFACTKEAGIYLYIDLGMSSGYFSSANKKPYGEQKLDMFVGDALTREIYKTGVSKVLTHVNPYTGTRLLDDPMLVCINFYNEIEFAYTRPSGKSKPVLERLWREWLKKKYPSVKAVSTAWKNATIAKLGSIDEIPLCRYSPGQDGNDFAAFVNERFVELLGWWTKTVRDIGYQGMVTQFDMGGSLFFTSLHDAISAISMHNYYAHPEPGALRDGTTIVQSSHVEDTAGVMRYFSAVRLFDKPFFITEYNHGFWNQYQHESGLIYGAYSAFQNLQGVLLYCNAVYNEVKLPMETFRSGLSPVGRANEFLAACLYMRGDVAPSPHRVELRLEPDYITRHMYPAANTEQSKIALLTGYGARYAPPGRPEPARKADMQVAPGAGAATGSTADMTVVEQSKRESYALKNVIDEMRRNGILPANNISNLNAEIFQSDTGEITLMAKEKKLTVVTPRTEAVTITGGKSAKLSAVNVDLTSIAACVAVCSMDRKPLRESRRMVLVYNTDTANTGMELSADRTTMRKQGKFPPLMQTGKLNVSIENANATKIQVWALGFNGTRREQIAATVKDGRIVIAIDTEKLKNGPTPFFEIVHE